jgi:hypothetical protein
VECSPCPSGYYCPGNRSIHYSHFLNSFIQFQIIGGDKTAAPRQVCPTNSYCPANSSAAIVCPTSTTSVGGISSISLSQCICSTGYYQTLNYNNACDICAFGNICSDGISYVTCPNNATTNRQGSTSLSECLCGGGYYGNETIACQLCDAGIYSPCTTRDTRLNNIPFICRCNKYTTHKMMIIHRLLLCWQRYLTSCMSNWFLLSKGCIPTLIMRQSFININEWKYIGQ